jgi:hypothetical protein
LRQVAASFDPLLAQLRNALPAPAPDMALPTNQPAADPAQSRAAATQLLKLLSEFDPGAADFIEANPAALRSLFPGDAWPQFEKLVQGYAFAEAQTQLEQALKDLPAA